MFVFIYDHKRTYTWTFLSVLRQAHPGHLQISGVRYLHYTTPTAGLQCLQNLLTTERAAYAAIPNQREVPQDNRELLSIAEVTKRLDVHETTVQR